MTNSNKTTDSTLQKMYEGLCHEMENLKKLLFTAKEVLTLEEAAIYLGVSKSSLYKMTHQRAIPFYKPNNKLVYFERSELLGGLRQNKAISQSEIDERANEVMRALAAKA